jgi:hypothetical protein
MNYIFGSGIIGLLAKKILGKNWKLVPFNKSRFFSFNPALDDNFIIRDDKLDEFIQDLTGNKNFLLYKRAYSLGGDLKLDHHAEYDRALLIKLFGEYPSQSLPYMKDRLSFFVYDIRVNALYDSLIKEYEEQIREEGSKGEVSKVGDHFFIRNNVRYDFDHLLSTIPLDVLTKYLGLDLHLKSADIQYLHVASDELDFEKCNQVMVVDPGISFYKVTNIAPSRYLFYSHKDILQPGLYLMNFMHNFDILEGTSIRGALPLGERPKMDVVEKSGIYCVGSSAEWDWCMDISSCILRIMRYAQRDNKPAAMIKM